MKNKFLSLVHNPLQILAIAGVFFGIAMIDSYSVNATSMGDLSLFGKIAIIPFLLALATLFVFYMLIPTYGMIIRFFKWIGRGFK